MMATGIYLVKAKSYGIELSGTISGHDFVHADVVHS